MLVSCRTLPTLLRGREVCTVSTSGPTRQQRRAKPTTKDSEGEPEILEGLARDIVSRLTTTLFGEGDVPVWERAGRWPESGAVVPSRRPGAADSGIDAETGGAPGRPEVEDHDRKDNRPGLVMGGAAAGFAVGSPPLRPVPDTGGDRPALLVRGTVRSGRQVRHNGDVVVLGDVNPGAQVVAARDILVIGTLRGMAHAGATGDHAAVVAAFRLSPTQLRIASYLARPPEEPGGHPEYPEMALVRDGVVVVRPLTTAMMSRVGAGDAEPDPASGRGGL